MDGRRIITYAFLMLLFLAAISPMFVLRENVAVIGMRLEAINVTTSNSTLGISSDTDQLHFGRIPLTGSSIKFVDISNPYDRAAKISIEIEGNISDFIKFSPEEMTLDSGDEQQVRFECKSESAGNYTGTLTVSATVPKYRASAFLLNYY